MHVSMKPPTMQEVVPNRSKFAKKIEELFRSDVIARKGYQDFPV